jgi:BolA-like protein 1
VWARRRRSQSESRSGAGARRATAGGDTQLTKGLVALFVLGLSGASAADVVEGAVEFIELPGTKQSLSLSRNSGVPSELAACGTAREWAAARREG